MQVSGLVVHRCLPLALVRWAPGRRWEHPSLQKVRHGSCALIAKP